jgi:urease accessory protein
MMARDSQRMRGARPFVFTDRRAGRGLDDVVGWIRRDLLIGA